MAGTTHNPLGRALGAMLGSQDDLLIAIASERLAAVFERHSGNVQATSEALGISVRTLFRWISVHKSPRKREAFGVKINEPGKPRETAP